MFETEAIFEPQKQIFKTVNLNSMRIVLAFRFISILAEWLMTTTRKIRLAIIRSFTDTYNNWKTWLCRQRNFLTNQTQKCLSWTTTTNNIVQYYLNTVQLFNNDRSCYFNVRKARQNPLAITDAVLGIISQGVGYVDLKQSFCSKFSK